LNKKVHAYRLMTKRCRLVLEEHEQNGTKLWAISFAPLLAMGLLSASRRRSPRYKTPANN
jgi:hypothetical protein